MANPREGEKELAPWAVGMVRENGGILEHPKGSSLWPAYNLPVPDAPEDEFGGWTLEIEQFHWGHKAAKATWLYIVGCPREEIPSIPVRDGKPTHVVSTGHGLRQGMAGFRSRVNQFEREYTPPQLARWLVDLASRCARMAHPLPPN